MKILIVDDEKHIRDLLKDYLENEGYTTALCENGLVAMDYMINNNDIDLILMDVRMPELDGFDALVGIRDYSDVPVVFLTALTETFDEIKGLDLGADDYITKPFTYELLMSRINVIKRRLKLDQVFEIEGLKLDQSSHRVWIEGVEVVITLKEFEMLRLLIKHKQTLSRSQLLDLVWGYEFDGDPRTLDTHIKTLRAKLKTYGDHIKTVRGVGYRFE